MTTAAIRNKLYDYIRLADSKKLHAIYSLLENEIEQQQEWWNDKDFVQELEHRYEALTSGADEGITPEAMRASVDRLREKRYGK